MILFCTLCRYICFLISNIHYHIDVTIWNKLTSNKLVSQRLGLRDGAETASGHLLRVELHRLLGNVESLLHDRSQLPDPPSLLPEHALCPCRHDDDLGPRRGDAHLHAGVSILGKLPSQELIQFRLENSVSDELKCYREVMFWFSTYCSIFR